MKLNQDLIRDILLTTEEQITYSKILIINWDKKENQKLNLLTPYTSDEIFYHLQQACKSNLIEAKFNEDFISVLDLTPKGHSYLENIRNDNNWIKIKSIANNLGTKSLDAMIQISSNVITELIKSHFNF
ncbi:hypothetical protein HMPREF2852_06685 [Anaerococcus sp. HMSC065G05]|uniref:DUF2513 domain-containing protein n=1 Tax=Anaerococcus sp. HMSC065G05 TaxID=1739356 RepID=UPI0008A1A4D5|nr:DUF2513 domain-containing protein [Anaerococcus sp. HMSC065G05]OFJ69711.1 hypothetical protein HMPREF2852_06685 [Anaerococcus sp. HMSC065G05]